MMEIRPPAHLFNIAKTSEPALQPASLKTGAILDVIVQARLGEDRFQFQLLPQGESLVGISLTKLSVGQRLQVEVIRAGTMPQLRILPAETQAPDVVTKALRELLPKQIDIRELTAMLGRLSPIDSPGLSDPVSLAVERLAATLPQVQKLMTPDGLQTALQNSGLFLEASLAAVLANGAPLPENDLKARLLNLLALLQDPDAVKKILQPATQTVSHQPAKQPQDDGSEREAIHLEKLAQKVEGALAKITVDQLESQPSDNGAISLQLNIPFAEGNYQDIAKLHIASEGAAAHDERINPAWTATIELQPPGMGAFNARIVWNGERIDACLWSDRKETTALISSASEILRARLEQAGLEAGTLTILDRPPPPTNETDTPPLLDLRA